MRQQQSQKRSGKGRSEAPAVSLETATGSEMQCVYWVQNYQDKAGEERSSWTRIGVAFTNRDGSQNLKLNFMPVGGDGNIHIRPFDTDEDN
jgi:hypothetical protein